MTSKTIMVGLVAIAFVAGSIMTGTMAEAAKGQPNGQPFQALWDAIESIELTPGPQGNPGLNGTDGTNGTDGIDGIQGIQGETGPQGPAGTIDPRFEDRLAALEAIEFPFFLRVFVDPNFPITSSENFWPINEPIIIDGWTAIESSQTGAINDRTDELVMRILAPNGTEIYNGPQPTTLIPDRNGIFQFVGTLESRNAPINLHVGGDIINLTMDVTIVEINGRDFIQVTTTGFYPGEELIADSDLFGIIGSGIVDENRVGIILSDNAINSACGFFCPDEDTITVRGLSQSYTIP